MTIREPTASLARQKGPVTPSRLTRGINDHGCRVRVVHLRRFSSERSTRRASILSDHGVRKSYNMSFGLLSAPSGSGRIADAVDVDRLLLDGHEIGCHTFDHLDSSVTSAREYNASLDRNDRYFRENYPGSRFRIMAYPLSTPSPRAKRPMNGRFVAARGGGQTYDEARIDLNRLNALFLDRRAADRADAVRRIVEETQEARGRLIFATHDVSDRSSTLGCNPALLDLAIRTSLDAGCTVAPDADVCRAHGWEQMSPVSPASER